MYELHWIEEEFYAQDGEWNTWNHSKKFEDFDEMKKKYEELKKNLDNKVIKMTQIIDEFIQD